MLLIMHENNDPLYGHFAKELLMKCVYCKQDCQKYLVIELCKKKLLLYVLSLSYGEIQLTQNKNLLLASEDNPHSL